MPLRARLGTLPKKEMLADLALPRSSNLYTAPQNPSQSILPVVVPASKNCTGADALSNPEMVPGKELASTDCIRLYASTEAGEGAPVLWSGIHIVAFPPWG